MTFNVPQFIEHEPKVVGPFTFKQFIFIGIAGGILFFLFFIIPSIWLFLLVAIVLLGGALVLALYKLNRIPLPTIIKNFFTYSLKTRIYIWKKKGVPPKFFRKVEKIKEEKKEESVLKIGEKSRLRELFTFLETRSK